MEYILAGKGLQEELDTLINNRDTKAMVSYMVTVHEDSAPWRCVAASRETEPHASASMIKVPILMAVFRAVEEGRLDLTTPIPLTAAPRTEGGGALQELGKHHSFSVLELCRLMMVLSDNWATNLLLRTIGMTYVNDMLLSYGATGTKVQRYMMDTAAALRGEENITTARDLILLFDRIFKDREASVYGHEMWNILGRQQFRDKLPFHWGEEVPFYHKTGCLDRVEHDGGILPLMTGNFGLVVMISDMENDKAIELTAAMGAVIKHFLEEKLPL